MYTPLEIRDRILAGETLRASDLDLSAALHPIVPVLLVSGPELGRGRVMLPDTSETIAAVWAADKCEKAASMVVTDREIAMLRDPSGQTPASVAVTVALHVAEWTVRRPEFGAIEGRGGRLVAVDCVDHWNDLADAVLRSDLLSEYEDAAANQIRKAAVKCLEWHPIFQV